MKQLAQTVYVEGRRYIRGATPPVEDAKKITNPMAWDGGELPDFGGAEDGGETTPPTSTAPPLGATGVMGGDAAIPAGDQPDKEGEFVGRSAEDRAPVEVEAPAGNALTAPVEVEPPAGNAPTAPVKVEPPAGNASTDAWRTYAVQSGQATATEVADLSRDELRDRYAPKA